MSSIFSDINTQVAFSVFESKGAYALLLGSGLSRAASIPTGWEITLDLIRRVGLAQGAEAQPDWAKWYREKTDEEPNYSYLLEELASSREERRSILHSYIEPTSADREEGRKLPTKAHYAIADLVADGFVRVIVTTNFDRLLENALRDRGVEPTIVSSVDALAGAEPITHSACYILKLHGDYKDARILNTDSELATYPPQYLSLLDRIFDEYGLIICGWSGEWDHALRAAFLRAPNRRYPIYWASRGDLSAAAQELTQLRGARVVAVAGADEFFNSLRDSVKTLSQSEAKNPLSIELLVNTTKRYLSKLEHRIQLHDLVEQETNALLQRTGSVEFRADVPWDIEVFRNRRSKYEAISEPLGRVVGVLGRWGNDNELPIVLDIIQSNVREAEKIGSGLSHYLSMRLYPSVLLFTAYGLGLVRAKRWRALHQLFSAEIDHAHREPKRAVDVMLAQAWQGGGNDVWNQLENKNLKTPISDHLHQLLARWGSSFATLTPDFELLFERFEVLGAFSYLETTSKQDIDQTLKNHQDFVWMPIGRSGWNARNAVKIIAEIQKEPLKSDLIKAGFAAGDLDLLNSSVTNFGRMAARMRWM